jgi:hypothetical protein
MQDVYIIIDVMLISVLLWGMQKTITQLQELS